MNYYLKADDAPVKRPPYPQRCVHARAKTIRTWIEKLPRHTYYCERWFCPDCEYTWEVRTPITTVPKEGKK